MITVQQAIELIIQELRSAQNQHPLFPTDPIHAVGIMAEEAGEATQAAHDFTYGGKHAEKLQKEIIQTGRSWPCGHPGQPGQYVKELFCMWSSLRGIEALTPLGNLPEVQSFPGSGPQCGH